MSEGAGLGQQEMENVLYKVTKAHNKGSPDVFNLYSIQVSMSKIKR